MREGGREVRKGGRGSEGGREGEREKGGWEEEVCGVRKR